MILFSDSEPFWTYEISENFEKVSKIITPPWKPFPIHVYYGTARF